MTEVSGVMNAVALTYEYTQQIDKGVQTSEVGDESEPKKWTYTVSVEGFATGYCDNPQVKKKMAREKAFEDFVVKNNICALHQALKNASSERPEVSLTPLAALEQLRVNLQSQGHVVDIRQDVNMNEGSCAGSVSIDGNVIASAEVQAGSGVLQKELMHKLALSLMKKCAISREADARPLLKRIPGTELIFVKGMKLFLDESHELECKGGKIEWDPMSAESLQFHLENMVPKNVCAFLNCRGGRMLLGVHDSTVVQGVHIPFADRDAVKRKIVERLRQTIMPSCLNDILVEFDPVTVLQNEATNGINGLIRPPGLVLTGETRHYVESLEKKLSDLLQLMTSNCPDELVVVRIDVSPSSTVHCANPGSSYYYRNDNETVAMPPDILFSLVGDRIHGIRGTG
eukprot:ANDGO_01899.mRNA.1 hypothetical protein DDB_G0287161